MSEAAAPCKLPETSEIISGEERSTAFDYAEPAELFTHGGMIPRIQPATNARAASDLRSARTQRAKQVTYRRYTSGTLAIRFAIEDLPAAHLLATVLVVNGDRYEASAIQNLYWSAGYPLHRSAAPQPRHSAATNGAK